LGFRVNCKPMIVKLVERHRYTFMALLSGAILIGSGVSLGVGLFGNQGAEVKETTNATKVSGIQIGDDLSDQTINEKININTASADELDLLPGIGSVYAQRIVDYRRKNGPFNSIVEIQNVAGIGSKTFEKLKDRITVK